MAVRANRKSRSRAHPRAAHAASALPRGGARHRRRPGHRARWSCRYRAAAGTDRRARSAAYDGQDFAALVIQQPNFFGALEDVDALTDWAHARGALVIAVVNPTSLALLKPPGAVGRDGRRHRRAATASRSAARCPPAGRTSASWRTRMELVRQMPGRIVGRTVDRRRPAGLHADAAGARAAHPPRQGDLQHLHQPGPAGDRGDDLPGADGRRGPGARRARLHGAHRRAGRGADARCPACARPSAAPCFHEAVLQLDRPVAPVLQALARARHPGRLRPGARLSRTRPRAAGLRHRDAHRPTTSQRYAARPARRAAALRRPA